MIVNAFAQDIGWLFSDLLRHFERHGCLATEVPTHADAWICIRSWEAPLLQWPEHSVIQIHANDPKLILGAHARPSDIDKAAALCFTNPEQPAILRKMGVSLKDKRCLLRPIGALECFTVREAMNPTPTFGWFGRDTGAKRTDLFTDAMETVSRSSDIGALLVGEHLTPHFERLAIQGLNATLTERRHVAIEDYPPLYKLCDAVVITSEREAGPMCLFEALACGVPVISTRCGWAEYLIQDGINGYLVDESEYISEDIASRMLDIASHRSEWYRRRHLIRATLQGWSLGSWVEDNVRLAMEVARGE